MPDTTTSLVQPGGSKRGSRWRVVAWSAAGFVLLPLGAMQFTDAVNWQVADFVFAGLLLAGVGGLCELTVRRTANAAYRFAVGVSLATAVLLLWVNGAVGIIGAEDNPANAMYAGVLAVGLLGSLLARFQPQGMAWALSAAALAHVLVTTVAVVAGFHPPASPLLPVVLLNGAFVACWLGSAGLFRRAA